jgi:hypothetical protein
MLRRGRAPRRRERGAACTSPRASRGTRGSTPLLPARLRPRFRTHGDLARCTSRATRFVGRRPRARVETSARRPDVRLPRCGRADPDAPHRHPDPGPARRSRGGRSAGLPRVPRAGRDRAEARLRGGPRAGPLSEGDASDGTLLRAGGPLGLESESDEGRREPAAHRPGGGPRAHGEPRLPGRRRRMEEGDRGPGRAGAPTAGSARAVRPLAGPGRAVPERRHDAQPVRPGGAEGALPVLATLRPEDPDVPGHEAGRPRGVPPLGEGGAGYVRRAPRPRGRGGRRHAEPRGGLDPQPPLFLRAPNALRDAAQKLEQVGGPTIRW